MTTVTARVGSSLSADSSRVGGPSRPSLARFLFTKGLTTLQLHRCDCKSAMRGDAEVRASSLASVACVAMASNKGGNRDGCEIFASTFAH